MQPQLSTTVKPGRVGKDRSPGLDFFYSFDFDNDGHQRWNENIGAFGGGENAPVDYRVGNFRVFSSQDPFPGKKTRNQRRFRVGVRWLSLVFYVSLSPDCETLHVNSIGILPVVKMIKACMVRNKGRHQ